MDIPQSGSSRPHVPGQIGIWNVSFCGGRKTWWPRQKTLRAKPQTKNKLNPHVATVVGGKYSHQCTIPGSLSVTMQSFASCFNHHSQIMHLRRWFINSNKDQQTKHLSFNLPFLEHKKLWSIHVIPQANNNRVGIHTWLISSLPTL